MNLLVIMSHELLDEQIEDAKVSLGVRTIKTLPSELLKFWRDIEPLGQLPLDKLNRIVQWVSKESKSKDYVLVQGEFGSTFYIVDYCLKNNRIPVYATTNRVAQHKIEGNKVILERVFKHGIFRKYRRFEKK